MAAYPDVEALLCNWLVERLQAGPQGVHRRIVPEVPDDLITDTALPCSVIERIGGYDHVIGLDVCRINVDTYTTGPDPLQARSAALARAEDIRREIRLHLVGKTLSLAGPVVSKVVVVSAPTIRPYDSRHQIRKAQALYQISAHASLTD